MPEVILAIDYGKKYVGLAIGNAMLKSARPLTTINNASTDNLWAELSKIVNEWRPDSFVVGMPLHMDGSPSNMSQTVEQFVKALQERYRLPVTTVDERLSTHEAQERLSATSKNKRIKKHDLNQVAAQVILETWFNQTKH